MKKIVSEIGIAIVVSVVLSLLILFLIDLNDLSFKSISFYLMVIVLTVLVSIVDNIEKLGLSFKISESISIALSLCITMLYAHTVSLASTTEMKMIQNTVYLHVICMIITGIRWVIMRKKK